MFNILSNAVSSLTSYCIFSILTSLLTYTVPTEHHILPTKLAIIRTLPVVLDIPFEVVLINRLVPVVNISPSGTDTWRGYVARFSPIA
jgi:hypothetical protein